jgi:hypothetical protein
VASSDREAHRSGRTLESRRRASASDEWRRGVFGKPFGGVRG